MGETYEVRLEDDGRHPVAHLVDRATEIHPRQPSIDRGPDTDGIAEDPLDPERTV